MSARALILTRADNWSCYKERGKKKNKQWQRRKLGCELTISHKDVWNKLQMQVRILNDTF